MGHSATAVTQNSGDKTQGISVVISSTTASLVYTGQSKHREIFLQNTSESFVVDCGTFSTITSASGIPRWRLPKFPTSFTTNVTSSIWCIGEPTASSIEIIGSYEFDQKD